MKGPFNKTTQTVPSFYKNQRWFTQDVGTKDRPPLPYDLVIGKHVAVHPNVSGMLSATYISQYSTWYGGTATGSGYSERIQAVHNKAYMKWMDKVRTQVQMGQNIAEANQTMQMIKNVLGLMRKPIASFNRVQKATLQKGRPLVPAKVLGDAWLQFHFGMEPLVKDLYELMKLMENQLRKKIVVHAQKRESWTFREDKLSTVGTLTEESWKLTARVSGTVEPDNRSLMTMNDLGITNPFLLAWELLPYSFVVDWFIPVGAYLGQLDALAGYKVTNGYSTWTSTGTINLTLKYPQIMPSNPASGKVNTFEHYRLKRQLGITMKWQKTWFKWSTSVVRAATSIGLLLQGLSKSRVGY